MSKMMDTIDMSFQTFHKEWRYSYWKFQPLTVNHVFKTLKKPYEEGSNPVSLWAGSHLWHTRQPQRAKIESDPAERSLVRRRELSPTSSPDSLPLAHVPQMWACSQATPLYTQGLNIYGDMYTYCTWTKGKHDLGGQSSDGRVTRELISHQCDPAGLETNGSQLATD